MPAEPALLQTARSKLYTSVLSDTLDSFGYRRQALPPTIRPLDDDLTLVGRARTGLFRDVYHVEPGENPYELEIALLDDLKPDDVAVLACGTSGRIAPWGELLSTAASMRGATGCLTDGLVRDVRYIRDMRFPVFAGGIAPLDSQGRGKLIAIDVPVEVGGVLVQSGDLVFGDVDGVVIIPSAVEEQILNQALLKVEGENATRECLQKGSRCIEVYEKFGVL
ncbi:MAG: RraA family protein [Gammaproteobacteria bacterium]